MSDWTFVRSSATIGDDGRSALAVLARQPLGKHVEIAGLTGRAANFFEPLVDPTGPLRRQPIAIEF